jgi:pSer/pThr/pTyr-binding forkhead associated (FHA) protein
MSVITLTLLHPVQAIPVQNWSFDGASIIRIGRATENNVILYSAVVSRRHLEIRQIASDWEIENFSANGTYINGKSITKAFASDGMILRLASSGPQIQIRITPDTPRANLTPTQSDQSHPSTTRDSIESINP